jgi:glutaredoxin
MKNLSVIVYTMKGCPHCDEFKKMLRTENIEYFERDIDEYSKEYDLYSEVTENDMVPALMIIEGDEKEYEPFLYAPERNYNELTEAISIIQEHRKKVGLIK